MNLADTPEEGYRDLLRRAEAYFRRLGSREHLPSGVREWLDDLDYFRTRELVEPTVEREHWIRSGYKGVIRDLDVDVPL